MELFIRIKDGQPFEHPIFGDNFREVFPHIDTNNLPPEFARFERVPCPENAGALEKNVVHYAWVNGIVKDVWSVAPMTEEEVEKDLAVRLKNINETVVVLKAYAANMVAETTGEEQQAWIDYQVRVDAWVLVDILRPQYPRMPRYLEDGTLVTNNTSGSAPNVIE